MREGIAFVAFTERGEALAERLSESMGGTVTRGRGEGFCLSDWTGEQFPVREALVVVGAAGIAVRAVAPWLKSKAEAKERALVYRGQLRAYAKALTRICGKPVKECLLYFLSVGETVPVPMEERG